MSARRPAVMVATLVLVAGGLLSTAPGSALAATDTLPDLRMQPLTTVRITVENGRRLLRFTAVMSNWGVGHFEVHATRPGSGSPWTLNQVIFDDAGGSREVATTGRLTYAGDGHNHWHIRDMNHYDLWGPSGSHREAKIGFCFLDTTPLALHLPGARQTSHYREEECDGASTTSIRAGISIGWGDSYPWHFAYQWVDITGVPAGTYILRSMVDPLNLFAETDDANNCVWVRLSIPSSGSPTILSHGQTCIDDIGGTPFASDIYWLYDQGLTSGCRVLLFCTYDSLSRGQMAAFLDRAMDLPATGTDFFTDDETSIFEASINRLAAAGITTGCGPTTFCPNASISREQMAAFLDRALKLANTGTDYFTDDEGSAFEKSINRAAAAGLTSGCGGTQFCPGAVVTRGQMAAFFHRAFG